jgi:DNA-binding transcriptional LysR family regulator
MDLRQLKTFRAVAELGSLSKASDRLRVAQPALSRHIKLLEHDLRTTLFVRHGRGMLPTDAGRMLFERTSGLVRQLEQARDDVLNASGAPTGRVVVGMVPTLSSSLASTVARQVVQQHPGIALRMVDAYGSFLVDWLHRGEIDIAVIYGPSNDLHLDVQSLRHDELYAVGPAGCGLSERESVSLGWMADKPLVLPSPPHALRVLIDDAYAAAKLNISVRVEADSFQALMDLVEGGTGFTFLPLYAAAAYLKRGVMEAAALRPSLQRELVIALPPQQRASLAAETVAKIVQVEAMRLGELGARD